jgi:hypothetical protein
MGKPAPTAAQTIAAADKSLRDTSPIGDGRSPRGDGTARPKMPRGRKPALNPNAGLIDQARRVEGSAMW